MDEQNNQNEEVAVEETVATEAPMNAPEKSMGGAIGAIIIVAIIVIGGIYFANKTDDSAMMEATTPETLQTQSTSDELGAIEEDLDAGLLEDLDAEFAAIEEELGL